MSQQTVFTPEHVERIVVSLRCDVLDLMDAQKQRVNIQPKELELIRDTLSRILEAERVEA